MQGMRAVMSHSLLRLPFASPIAGQQNIRDHQLLGSGNRVSLNLLVTYSCKLFERYNFRLFAEQVMLNIQILDAKTFGMNNAQQK